MDSDELSARVAPQVAGGPAPFLGGLDAAATGRVLHTAPRARSYFQRVHHQGVSAVTSCVYILIFFYYYLSPLQVHSLRSI